MSSIADRIKIAQDKDGMLRRALERIIQLYTDRSHFVYELLQNAEDAEAKCIRFVQYSDRLEVLHDGKPFTSKNLQGLCDIGKSDKVDNLNQIGEFGVGFKSVFGICDTVLLYSDPSHFRNADIGDAIPFSVEITDFTSPKDIAYRPLNRSYTTRFVFPYTVGRTFSGFKTVEELNRTLSSKLQNLGITTLLFMKNLELIEYEIRLGGKSVEGQYLLEKNTINDHCSLVSALGLLDTVNGKGKKTEEISYLKFSRAIDSSSQRTVDIAFPVVINEAGEYVCQRPNNPYISVYFPTETESKLGFIVQGPYRTTPNRSSIPADEEDNIRLANETALLLRESILELRDTGKLNMSFVKALPLSVRSFDNYALFRPLYEMVRNLFVKDNIIPCRNGGYVTAEHAIIARQEKLASLFSDDLLTKLIHDGAKYFWLPTYLTETNREYETVYKYLTVDLKITVIRPEDLRTYFAANPKFLPQQTEDWLVELYSILENVGAAFSKARNETNMLTANIIKTSTGEFVAAYRKTENKQYIPNVFLPSKKIRSADIHFVDAKIYNRCRHFFDDILQLQQPNEYEFFVSDIKRRYSGSYKLEEVQHIADLKQLHKYLQYEEYKGEILRIIKDIFVIRCNDGILRNAFSSRIFFPESKSGINIEGYLMNITKNVFFVDLDFYSNYDVTVDMLSAIGVLDSILYNHNVVKGQYDLGNHRGRMPEWWTAGDFRWKLTIEYLKEALKYIADHPEARDSIIKSKTILAILLENETKVCGTVHIGGTTPNKEHEPCELIHVLRGEHIRDWNGKWLYTESMELVSHKHISKHDISTAVYGKVKQDSIIYELLGFRKTDSDEVDELKKIVPQKQLDAYFEDELRRRFGLSSADLADHFETGSVATVLSSSNEVALPFPAARVKNWEALRKHAAEMLIFADPVKYDYAVRRIRVSNHDKEARAYLRNLYRYDGQYRYACQMCHDSCADIEAVQIFNNPEAELDPMNICLCPNCAAVYRRIRGNTAEMDLFRNKILAVKEQEMTGSQHVVIEVDSQSLWFTQIHVAEIQALLQLDKEVKGGNKVEVSNPNSSDKSGLSVYSSYKGKRVVRKDGFSGIVSDVIGDNLIVTVVEEPKNRKGKGPKVGDETKIQISFISSHPGVYSILDS